MCKQTIANAPCLTYIQLQTHMTALSNCNTAWYLSRRLRSILWLMARRWHSSSPQGARCLRPPLRCSTSKYSFAHDAAHCSCGLLSGRGCAVGTSYQLTTSVTFRLSECFLDQAHHSTAIYTSVFDVSRSGMIQPYLGGRGRNYLPNAFSR